MPRKPAEYYANPAQPDDVRDPCGGEHEQGNGEGDRCADPAREINELIQASEVEFGIDVETLLAITTAKLPVSLYNAMRRKKGLPEAEAPAKPAPKPKPVAPAKPAAKPPAKPPVPPR